LSDFKIVNERAIYQNNQKCDQPDGHDHLILDQIGVEIQSQYFIEPEI